MRFAIVGGGGYIGYHICVDLVQKKHKVVLVDLQQPDEEWMADSDVRPGKNENVEFFQGNVLDITSLESAFKNVDCVIHCASYGMSGKEQMPAFWDKTEAINVTGTCNVVKACKTNGVKGLVYTSTFNVVFGGQEIHNGDESLPYFPLHRHIDHYSRTKSIAEQLVLMANNTSKSSGVGSLSTCALRLAGVMGVKEKRHLPRIVDSLPMLKFKYGYGESLVQFCDIKNVVQAHVKAALGILKTPDVIGGQAYFISDEVPINNLEYFRPLILKLGHKFPTFVVPMWFMWFVAFFVQFMHSAIVKVFPSLEFAPVITPAEIYKTAVTHYFSCEKARKHFGYKAVNPNDTKDIVDYFYRKSKLKSPKSTNKFVMYIVITVLVAVIYMCLI